MSRTTRRGRLGALGALAAVLALLLIGGSGSGPGPSATDRALAALSGAEADPRAIGDTGSRGERPAPDPSQVPVPPARPAPPAPAVPVDDLTGLLETPVEAPPETAPDNSDSDPAEPDAPPPSGPTGGSGDSSAEGEVLALVNSERAAAGCGAVSADSGLTALARAHSADMRDRNFFSHTDPSGQDPWDRAAAAGVGNLAAENIAAGQSSAAAVMQAWMDSPGHRANILNCELGTLGVGVAYGGGSGTYWTQNFGF